jgi:hypothetical protein
VPYQAFYVNDYVSAYNMMHNGEIDAFIAEAVGEASFDKMGNVLGVSNYVGAANVVAEDFFPLIYEPVSLSTQNPEFQPIISIVQKALENGGINDLADLYEQGMKEYAQGKLLSRFDERELAHLRENTAVSTLPNLIIIQ